LSALTRPSALPALYEAAGVARDRVVDDLDMSRLAFHLHDGDVDAAGERRPRRLEVTKRLEPWFHPGRPGQAGGRGARELPEREPAVRGADHANGAVDQLEVRLGDFEQMGR